VTFILLVGVFGILEFILKSNIYLDNFLSSQDVGWYVANLKAELIGEPYRIKTTLGHPLSNAAYFLAAFTLLLYLLKNISKKKFLFSICAFVILTALILTFSRSAFILSTTVIITFITGYKSGNKTIRILVFTIFIIGGIIILQPLITLLAGRDLLFGDASASVRFSTIAALFQNFSSITFIGYGPKNMDNAINSLLGSFSSSSLEIGYVIVLLQFGIFFLALYTWGILLPFYEKKIKITSDYKHELTPYAACLVVIIIYFGASNTIGVRSTINYLFFVLLSLFSSKIILIKQSLLDKDLLR